MYYCQKESGLVEDRVSISHHLITYVSLQISLAQQSGYHLSEAGSHEWQIDASDHNMITWLGFARHLTAAHNSQRARNVAGRHLIAMLLDLDLLEFNEFRTSGL